VHLLDELARQTPEGVYLRAIKQEGPKVNVSGFAASNERVSEYLRNLQNNSRFLDRPDLIEIKLAGGNPPQQAVSSRRLFEFSLSFFMKPTAERVQLAGDRAGAAAGAPGAKTAAAAKR
jgi:type IV pilus assembly protein PilN